MISPDAPREPQLVAILRGITPDRVVDIADVLYKAGIRTIEIPLNSPDPYTSIRALAAVGHDDWLIGAGTVLTVEDVKSTGQAGGRLIVAPNCDADVIRAGLALDMRVLPGIATATEAFRALRAGARELKLFPAVTYGPRHLSALGAVLPATTRVFPVGGIGAADISAWLSAGAAGFGFGSELFHPSYSRAEIERRASQLVRALREAVQSALSTPATRG